MSARQVLATVRSALQDATTGVAARVTTLKAADPSLATVRTDFAFPRWLLSGQMQPASQPNLAVAIESVLTEQKLASLPTRDGEWTVTVGFECFDADAGVIEDSVTTVMLAVCQVLDELREYSDAHGGTILAIQGSLNVRVGPFDGPATSNGFLCRFTLLERSTQ